MVVIYIGMLFLIAYGAIMLAYSWGWHRMPVKRFVTATRELKLSIIIPARNEASNIAACLQSIINNNYPKALYEIIVIDDFSEDDTAIIATNILGSDYGKVLRLQSYLSPNERLNAYKKKALELAIAEAQGDWIITVDADCIAPPHWLHSMTGMMQQSEVKFVAAPVSFTPFQGHKSLLYYFQSLDFMTMQGITAASAYLKWGNMCNGANLAFEKSAFYAVDGYRNIDHKASGDDMFLMQKIHNQFPQAIAYNKDPEAIMQTPVQPDAASFLNQRIRWSSKNDSYTDKRLTAILGVVYFLNVMLLISTIVALFKDNLWQYIAVLFILKILIELWFLFPVARFYSKGWELLYFVILQPFHVIYIVAAGFLGKFGTYKWKGRRVH
jgi:glycosyltransferase involved in cell wall biosynthesis